jgi:tetratricopeptide (TPR) repeat protein
MTSLLFVLFLQAQIAMPARATLPDPSAGNPVPKQMQKDYDQLWKRFLSGKDDAKVFADLDKVSKKNPDVVPPLLVQAYLDLYSGRLKDGEQRLRTALSKRPSDTVALRFLAEIAYARNDFVEANDFYTRLRSSGSTQADMKSQRALLLAVDSLLQDARLAERENRLVDAERSYRRALQLAPREAALHGHLAEVLRRAGNGTEAEAELRVQQQLNGPGGALVASDNDLTVNGLEDLGRWGNQIERFREIRAAKSITREQFAALFAGYFPQLTEFRHVTEIMTDTQDSWAQSSIQLVVDVGILDPTPNHTFQPHRTLTRGEFAVAVARLTRLLGLTPTTTPPISPLDVIPGSALDRELQPVLAYGLLPLDKAGNFGIGALVPGEEAVNTAEKLLHLIHK